MDERLILEQDADGALYRTKQVMFITATGDYPYPCAGMLVYFVYYSFGKYHSAVNTMKVELHNADGSITEDTGKIETYMVESDIYESLEPNVPKELYVKISLANSPAIAAIINIMKE